jgi:hypothetical protein
MDSAIVRSGNRERTSSLTVHVSTTKKRISSQVGKVIGVAIEQLRLLKPLFGARRVIVVADRWYGTPQMLQACRALGYSVLIRLKSNRKLYRKPVRRHQRGTPPKDGALLQGTRPETQTDPVTRWEGTDPTGRLTRVSRFDELHFQQARDLPVSVLRVERASARDTKRDPRVSWFLTLDDAVPLQQVPQRYGLRFSQEHLFRFCKQDLLWCQPRLCTTAQFELWSWIVVLAFTQLYLARPLGLATLLPWEAKGRPVTPRQVRWVMPAILGQLGTPLVCANHEEKHLDGPKASVLHPCSVIRSLAKRVTRRKSAKRPLPPEQR